MEFEEMNKLDEELNSLKLKDLQRGDVIIAKELEETLIKWSNVATWKLEHEDMSEEKKNRLWGILAFIIDFLDMKDGSTN